MTPPPRSKLKTLIGPGLITGASDDDPSGIGTYSQVGAQFGFGTLWLIVVSYPLMVAAQLVSAQIGRVTGRGLGANIRQQFPSWFYGPVVMLLVMANAINIGADLGAMGAATQLLLGGPALPYTAGLGLLSLLLQVFVPYSRYVSILKWLTLAVFAYVGTALVSHVQWNEVLVSLVQPKITWNGDYMTAVVALLGTTISPYLFFWQASEEVEEQQATAGELPLKRAPQQAEAQMGAVRSATYFGMAVSNIIAFFIIVTAAATLHANGITEITSAAQAAKALEPIAGRFAEVLFAAGMVGTGLLAVPVLAGSSAYALGEVMKRRVGLEERPARAPFFYAVIAVSTVVGIGMNLLQLNPMKALYWSAVINGAIAAPILAAVMCVAVRKSVMGKLTISPALRRWGWMTTFVMAGCALALFLQSAAGLG
ncbi:MAG: divalent metal cation transporter [Rubrivivax sp.]|nr:MAG: divalent metal cation transporter [Rubrivivax sp.]